jgi:hypothetical protein
MQNAAQMTLQKVLIFFKVFIFFTGKKEMIYPVNSTRIAARYLKSTDYQSSSVMRRYRIMQTIVCELIICFATSVITCPINLLRFFSPSNATSRPDICSTDQPPGF